MESFDLGNTALIQETAEKEPKEQFSKEFHSVLGQFLQTMSLDFKPSTDIATEQHEGPYGIIPPPARRHIARDILAGNPSPPLKILEETIEGPLERRVAQLAFHMLVEVNPLSATNPTEVEETVSLITILAERLQTIQQGRDVWTWPNNDHPPIRVQTGTGYMHLLQRNVIGNYMVQSLPLNSKSDVLEAIQTYKQSLSDVYKVSPEDKPKVDAVAHMVEFSKIGEVVQKDTGEGKLSLPIIMYPKQYNNWSIHEGYHLLAANKIPFMLRQGEERGQWQLLRESPSESTSPGRQFISLGDNTVKEFDDEPDLGI